MSGRARAGRRLAAFLGGAALVAAGLGVGAGLALDAAVPAQAQVPAFTFTSHAAANFTGATDQPVYVLVVGNDERPGVGGRRADALHLVGINPAAGSLTILDFPRDSWVAFPDGSGRHRINEGNPRGGPGLQAQVVSELVGVPIAFTVEVNFAGFTGLIDELGGVEVDVPMAMHDQNSGAHFVAGVQHMTGAEALAFSRNRHIPGGDLTRSRNQSSVLVAALVAARQQVSGPAQAVDALSTFLRYGELHGTDWDDLYRLGRLVLGIDPATIRAQLVPGTPGNAGGASVVFLDDDVDQLFADFADDAVLQTFPSDPPL